MKHILKHLIMLAGGAFFGFGLAYSGMNSPEVVLGFLNFKDFGLMLVMGGAIAVTVLAYQFIPRRFAHPLLGQAFDVRKPVTDIRLLVGAAIFGIGWGVAGVCPGPSIAGLGAGNFKLLWAVAGIFAGAYVQAWLASKHTVA